MREVVANATPALWQAATQLLETSVVSVQRKERERQSPLIVVWAAEHLLAPQPMGMTSYDR